MKNKIIKEKDIAILLKGAVYLEDKDAAVLLPEICAICPEAIVGEGITVKQSDVIPQLNQVPEYAIWYTNGNTENVNMWGWHETTYDPSIDWGRYNDATSLYIGEGLTEISGCPDNVCYIHLPESINHISSAVFLGKHSLRIIDMPSKVESVGSGVFSSCYNLKSICIPEGVTELAYGPNGFFSLCYALEKVMLPETLLSIGSEAFYYCESLTSITIPNSVTSIGERVFEGCSALTEILVDAANPNYSSEDGILYNKDKTNFIFCPCTKQTVTIPNSVTSVGNGAFMYCSSLTDIVIPNSVTSIGELAFCGCNSMHTIYIEATTPPILSSYDFDFVTAIYVPAEFVETYKTATNWSYYSDIIQAMP